jgi:hypothetical protein
MTESTTAAALRTAKEDALAKAAADEPARVAETAKKNGRTLRVERLGDGTITRMTEQFPEGTEFATATQMIDPPPSDHEKEYLCFKNAYGKASVYSCNTIQSEDLLPGRQRHFINPAHIYPDHRIPEGARITYVNDEVRTLVQSVCTRTQGHITPGLLAVGNDAFQCDEIGIIPCLPFERIQEFLIHLQTGLRFYTNDPKFDAFRSPEWQDDKNKTFLKHPYDVSKLVDDLVKNKVFGLFIECCQAKFAGNRTAPKPRTKAMNHAREKNLIEALFAFKPLKSADDTVE